MTMMGFSVQSDAMRALQRAGARHLAHRPPGRSSCTSRPRTRLQQGQLAPAQTAMEQAVALSPRDAGYRQLLADIYLKQGRFASARDHLWRRARARSVQRPRRAQRRPDPDRAGQSARRRARLDDLDGRAPGRRSRPRLCACRPRRPRRRRSSKRPPARPARPPAPARISRWLMRCPAIGAAPARSPRRTCRRPSLPARLQQWAAFARPGAGATRVAACSA